MVVPVVMGAIAVGSAIAQWQQSESARQASSDERRRMAELLRNIEDPNFDMSQIDPAQYAVVRKYVPQAAPFIEEQAPTLVKGQSADAKLGGDVEREALQRYRDMAVAGEDPIANIQREQGLRRVRQDAQGRAGALEQSFARRGMGGSGLEFLAQLVGQQDANQNAQASSEDAVLAAQRSRLEALRGGASLGGTIRNREVAMEGQNAGILNEFNSRTANRQQQVVNANTDRVNDGERFNITNEQDVGNRNVAADYQNRVRTQDQNNQLQQQQFSNAMSRATGQNAVSQQAIGDTRQNAQDRNAAIGGAAAGASAVAQSIEDREERQKDRDAYGSDPLRRRY